jgi:hypothetical protein
MANTNLSLQPYSREAGLELLIDTETGAVYASQSALAIICQQDEREISRFYETGEIDGLELKSEGGRRGLIVFDEKAIKTAISYYHPGLASKLMGIGLRAPVAPFDVESSSCKEIKAKGRRVAGAVVYLVGDGDFFKIGTSTKSRLKSRMAAIQTGNPKKLSLYSTVSGGLGLERQIHRRLAKHGMQGEWFCYSDEMFEIFNLCPQAIRLT